MAPKTKRKSSKTYGQFKLSKSPFVEDSAKEKIKRWNLADPVTLQKEEAKTRKEKKKKEKKSSPKPVETESESEASNDENEEAEDDQNEDDSDDEPSKDVKPTKSSKKKQRRKSAGDIEIVDWPETPDRSKSSEPTTKTNQDEVKKPKGASTPRKRIRSDGNWIRMRNPPKKISPPKPPPPPKPKVAKYATGPAGAGWVRSGLLPRQSSSGNIKPLPADVDKAPVVRYKGRLKKPVWHQFDVEKERARIAAKKAAQEQAANANFDFRISKAWDAVTKKATTIRPDTMINIEDLDFESDSEVESGRNSPDLNRNTSIQRSPTQINQKKLRRRGSHDPQTDGESQTRQKRDSSAQHEEESSLSLPSKYHRRGKSEGNLEDERPLETHRKPSNHADGTAPVVDKVSPANGITNRLAAWLTAAQASTQDPFTSSNEKNEKIEKVEKNSKPSLAKRFFSFERTLSVTKTSPPARQISPRGPQFTPSRAPKSYNREEDRNYPRSAEERYPDRYDDDESEYYDDASSTSTPTLRRSGARRSAHLSPGISPKARRDDDYTESEISASVISASTDPSSGVSSARPHDALVPEPLSPHRQLPPSTGKRLSTIVSIESFDTRAKPETNPGSKVTDEPPKVTTRDLAKPLPRSPEKATIPPKLPLLVPENASTMSRAKSVMSIRSTKSTRSLRSRLANKSIKEIMSDLAADEESFLPELKTLVGGVIKVLLRAVISHSDAAVAAGLFSQFLNGVDDEKNAKHAIHEMCVALERLKSYHIRIPTQNTRDFLTWASGAHRIYEQYVKTWRLGFQDVVVELVPEDDGSNLSSRDGDNQSMADAMPRNDKGYVVNKNGELVDVAFLLKRPLVRLKFITKTIRSINCLEPTPESERLTKKYDALMETTRNKVNSERARIEDQKAAQIDATRARDPKTMAALAGVKIDPKRNVRARDHFDMHFIHSSGQETGARVEILLRDDPPGAGYGGDILICQVDEHGRWLFLPPVLLRHVSARKGAIPEELIVMIRGHTSRGQEWRELMSLKSGDGDAANDWLKMLGTIPTPPAFDRSLSKRRPASSRGSSILSGSEITESTDRELSRPPSPTPTDILPVGERAGPDAKQWGMTGTPDRDRSRAISPLTPITPMSDERQQTSPNEHHDSLGVPGHTQRKPSSRRKSDQRDYFETAPEPHNTPPSLDRDQRGLRRTRAFRQPSPIVSPEPVDHSITTKPARHHHERRSEERETVPRERRHTLSAESNKYKVWMPKSDYDEEEEEDDDMHFSNMSDTASLHRRTSSMPQHNDSRLRSRTTNDQYGSNMASSSRTPDHRSSPKVYTKPVQVPDDDTPPPPPPHRHPVKKSPPGNITIPQLTPSGLKRVSSSPLKHEYQPSESEHSISGDESEESDGFLESDSEDERIEPSRAQIPAYQSDLDSITPSQSASQGPFNRAPEGPPVYLKILAGVSRWQNGSYIELNQSQCYIEVTPGKLSAYEAVADYHGNTVKKPHTDPIVSVHLTPSVFVQSTNACDVMVRSKPCADSRFQLRHDGTFNLRLHTRGPTMRGALYDAIGESKHNNPTYLALERARPKETEAERFDRQNPGSAPHQGGASWWGGSRKSSFRKAQTRSGSTVGNTEKTYRSTSSIKRGLNSLMNKASFNIEKSAIFSKTKSRHQHSSSRDYSDEHGGRPQVPADAFALTYPEELQHTLQTATCRVISIDKSVRGSGAQKPRGKATMRVLPAPRKPTGSVLRVDGPEGLRGDEAVRVVLSNKDTILFDKVLPPLCFTMGTRGITIHAFSGGEQEIRQRGGVGTWVKEEIFLDGFETESMRQFIYQTLTRGAL